MLLLFLFSIAFLIPINIFILKWNLTKFLAVVALILGIFRLQDYFTFGDQHHKLALIWAIHALATGVLLLWFSRDDQPK